MAEERESTLIRSFRDLAVATPRRGRDGVLRALDVALAALFLLVSLPLTALLALALLVTSGRPLFYRGERVGRGGRIFGAPQVRALKGGAAEGPGPSLGEGLVR